MLMVFDKTISISPPDGSSEFILLVQWIFHREIRIRWSCSFSDLPIVLARIQEIPNSFYISLFFVTRIVTMHCNGENLVNETYTFGCNALNSFTKLL